MKSHLLAVALTVCLTSPLWAQDTSSDSSGSGSSTPPPEHHHHWGGGGLTDDQMKEVKAAHDAALQNNPQLAAEGKELRADQEAYDKKMHDAMVAADPKVEAILAKMPHHHHGPPPGGDDGGGSGGGDSSNQ